MSDILDNDAERLFQELGDVLPDDGPMATAAATELSEEAEDEYRLKLIELVHLVSVYLQDAHLLDGVRSKKDSFEELVQVLTQLSALAEHEGTVLVRYRGFTGSADMTGKTDYVVVFGNVIVDTGIANAMVKRRGIRLSHVAKRLVKAFDVFSTQGINTLHMRLPEGEDRSRELEHIRIVLSIFARYNQAFQMSSPITFKKDGREVTLPLIRDEKGQPDPNLTMLAGLNDLSPRKAKEMVQKVDSWMKSAGGDKFATVYDAVFAVQSLQRRLIRPPIEVNNIQWRMVGRGQKVVVDGREGHIQGGGAPDGYADDSAAEENDLAEEPAAPPAKSNSRPAPKPVATEASDDPIISFVMTHFGKSPPHAARIIKSVNGRDYRRLNAGQLGERLALVSEILEVAEAEPEGHRIESIVLPNLMGKLEQSRDKVLIALETDGRSILDENGEAMGTIHPKVSKVFSVAQGRAVLRHKIRNIMRGGDDFSDADYAALARDFSISVKDARGIVGLLQECFDSDGHFIRKSFERNIPQFVQYERKIFEFMWHYLKETFHRNDRVAFLNSLQLLISEMKQPKKAISTLMTDFLKIPAAIGFSDRNALMLSNLLIRKYNKELNLDIEITPEEVLLVKEGVDKEISEAVSRVIDSNRLRFIKKIETIREQIAWALGAARTNDAQPLPLRYLLSLEREVVIFLSLVGGQTAGEVLRSAVKVYGNSGSEMYRFRDSRNQLVSLLQHLKIILRGMGRLGTDRDLRLLDEVSWGEQGFMRMALGDAERDKIKQVMRWVDLSKEIIVQKSWKDDRDTHAFRVV